MFHGLVLLIHITACLVLIAVILLQAGRGGGLADTFGSGTAQSIFGTRGTVFLTRATTAFATVFMITSLTLAVMSVQQGKSLVLPAAARAPQGQAATPVVPITTPPAPTEPAPEEASKVESPDTADAPVSAPAEQEPAAQQ